MTAFAVRETGFASAVGWRGSSTWSAGALPADLCRCIGTGLAADAAVCLTCSHNAQLRPALLLVHILQPVMLPSIAQAASAAQGRQDYLHAAFRRPGVVSLPLCLRLLPLLVMLLAAFPLLQSTAKSLLLAPGLLPYNPLRLQGWIARALVYCRVMTAAQLQPVHLDAQHDAIRTMRSSWRVFTTGGARAAVDLGVRSASGASSLGLSRDDVGADGGSVLGDAAASG